LFQTDKHYDISYDTGDKAIQCGRHNDIFKFWLMWRARGDYGFEAQIDYLMDMTRLFLHPNFVIYVAAKKRRSVTERTFDELCSTLQNKSRTQYDKCMKN